MAIVGRNVGAFVEDALLSARAQTYTNIEILFVDDDSADDTRAKVLRHVMADNRIRLLDGPAAGLSAVRNVSLAESSGDYVAILDSDDIIHPEHVARLLSTALHSGAEIVAGAMLSFHGRGEGEPPTLFPAERSWSSDRSITLMDYVRGNILGRGGAQLGYLKPMFRRSFLTLHRIAYNTNLRIGEDYDIVARALAAGAKFQYSAEPTYFYRRHAASTSYRLTKADLLALVVASDLGIAPGLGSELATILDDRRKSLLSALAHLEAVEALKSGRFLIALKHLLGKAGASRLLLASVKEGLARRASTPLGARRNDSESARRPVVLVLGTTPNGSATATVIEFLASAGYRIERQPSLDPIAVATSSWSLPSLDLILAASPMAAEACAYALEPQVPAIVESGAGSQFAPGPVLRASLRRNELVLETTGEPVGRLSSRLSILSRFLQEEGRGS